MKVDYSSAARNPCGSLQLSSSSIKALGLRPRHGAAFAMTVASFVTTLSTSAFAVDGCKVLLCLAAPNWRNVQECVPTIQQLMRDLRRGRPFPVCDMSGNNNYGGHDWARAPAFCPPQYTREVFLENSIGYECQYEGAITTVVNGAVFTRTWWRDGGDSVTEYSAAAKAQLGQWDPRFDNDYAAWLAIQPPPAAPDNP